MHQKTNMMDRLKTACLNVLAAGVIMFSFSYPAAAADRQYKIESAYLYSFFNYITWPGYDSPQKLKDPVICIAGNDPILPYLDYIRNKMAGERTLTIRAAGDDGAFAGCHILFVRHRIPSRLLSGVPNDTLIVLKPDDPLDRGGMIELTEDGERISININQPLIEGRGFLVSSRLLDLAREVK